MISSIVVRVIPSRIARIEARSALSLPTKEVIRVRNGLEKGEGGANNLMSSACGARGHLGQIFSVADESECRHIDDVRDKAACKFVQGG